MSYDEDGQWIDEESPAHEARQKRTAKRRDRAQRQREELKRRRACDPDFDEKHKLKERARASSYYFKQQFDGTGDGPSVIAEMEKRLRKWGIPIKAIDSWGNTYATDRKGRPLTVFTAWKLLP